MSTSASHEAFKSLFGTDVLEGLGARFGTLLLQEGLMFDSWQELSVETGGSFPIWLWVETQIDPR